MEITKDIVDAAESAVLKKTAFPAVVAVRYDRRIGRIVIELASGLELAFSPKQVQGLEDAHVADLLDSEITPSGLGIYFPKLDADIYIPALLEGFLGSKRWMAAENGKLCGASASLAKAAAARQNGKLGGRPKKLAQLNAI